MHLSRLPFAFAFAFALIGASAAVVAQTDPPRQPTAAVAGANADISATADAKQAGEAAVTLDTQAQYAADMAAYRRALNRNDRRQRRYARNQRAYADAMAAWRVQVSDCHHGVRAACNAPTPNPADFR